jgi:hypothetical protein
MIHGLQGTRSEDFAGPFETALVAIAICRHAEVSRAQQSSPAPAAVTLAHDALIHLLAVRGVAGDQTLDPTGAAAMVIACAEVFKQVDSPKGDWWPASRDALAAKVLACIDEEGKWAQGVPIERRGMIVRAIAELSVNPAFAHADPRLETRGKSAIVGVYRETKPGFLATQMPWLYEAHLRLDGEAGELAQAGPLREMRKLLWERQVKQEQLITLPIANDPGQDLVGGIDLTQDASIDADWRTLRVLPALARMAHDPRLTDADERTRELARVLHGARFVRQLCMDDSAASFSSDPRLALWGVRSAPWDARLPLEASAMGLISLSETLRLVDALSAEQEP